jgi:hypothetical protein
LDDFITFDLQLFDDPSETITAPGLVKYFFTLNSVVMQRKWDAGGKGKKGDLKNLEENP